MTSPNRVSIDIEVNQTGAGLDKIADRARDAGRRTSKAFEQSAGEIDRAFDKTSRSLANTLDKIEREAWQSGRGMDDAFGTAMSGLRKSLELARTEAAETGAGLHSSIGGALNEVRRGADQLAASLRPVEQAAVKVNQAFDKTARLVGVELDRIERDAWVAGRGTDQAFQTALRSVRDDFERVRDVGRRTGASLESEMGQALRSIKRDMDALGDEAKQTGREIENAVGDNGGGLGESLAEGIGGGMDFGGMLEGALGRAGMGAGVAAAGAAIGGLVADQIIQGFDHSMNQLSIGGKLAAASGKDLGFAVRAGRVVGDAWEDGFGDSMEDVAETANQALAKGLADTPEQLSDVTKKIEVIGEVTGRSAEEIASAARAMVKGGLVDSLDEAFDAMVAGAQRGADAGGDMLDAFAQNSVTLKQFGLDASTSMGAFKQALDAGAPSADTFVGALEELSGNAYDAIPVFEELGLGGIDFANALAGGGPKAKAALDSLLDSIRKIPDPAERSRVMVGLFGEEATAMGDALLAVDLDKASQGFDDIAGSADKATAATQAMKNPLEALQRDTTGMISDPFEHLWDVLADPAPAENVDKTAEATGKAKDEAGGAAKAADDWAVALDKVVEASSNIADLTLTLSGAQIDYQAAIDTATEALKENGKTLDINTEKGRDNKSNLDDIAGSTWDLITAMEQQGASTEEVRGFMEGARQQFINTAVAMGMDRDAANELANKLRLIPGDYNAHVGVDAGQALGALAAVRNAINNIPRNVTTVIQSVVDTVNRRETGGLVSVPIWGAATGGSRHSSTMMNEAGPEVAELPNGSRVMTAGATRALAESGALGGGGGPSTLVVEWSGRPTDELGQAFMNYLRDQVKFRYGGDAQRALGGG